MQIEHWLRETPVAGGGTPAEHQEPGFRTGLFESATHCLLGATDDLAGREQSVPGGGRWVAEGTEEAVTLGPQLR